MKEFSGDERIFTCSSLLQMIYNRCEDSNLIIYNFWWFFFYQTFSFSLWDSDQKKSHMTTDTLCHSTHRESHQTVDSRFRRFYFLKSAFVGTRAARRSEFPFFFNWLTKFSQPRAVKEAEYGIFLSGAVVLVSLCVSPSPSHSSAVPTVAADMCTLYRGTISYLISSHRISTYF